MEEMRMGRDRRWPGQARLETSICADSLYAERLPIGVESVIREGAPEVFRTFYKKWYRPERMAIVAAGDFADLDEVASDVREGAWVVRTRCGPTGEEPEVHRPLIAPHEEPRITCVVDKEHTKTTVTMTFKYEANQVSTLADISAKRWRRRLAWRWITACTS